MKLLAAAVLLTCLASAAQAQYPKTISLTITKITRTQKNTAACDNCATITTLEVHTETANLILTCEADLYPEHSENNSYCAQFEPGTYKARRLSPEVVSFFPPDAEGTSGQNLVLYTVVVEEMRTKTKGT
jgi:hypothetical protein